MPELSTELVPAPELDEAFDSVDVLGRLSKDLKPWHADKFNHRHRVVCIMKASGLKNNEIAEMMGYDQSTVSIILNDPRAEAYLEEAATTVVDSMADVGIRLKAYAHEALTEVVDLMRNSTKDDTRQRSAFSILDRAGYGRIEKSVRIQAEITEKAARVLMGAAEEADAEAIEADYSIEPERV